LAVVLGLIADLPVVFVLEAMGAWASGKPKIES